MAEDMQLYSLEVARVLTADGRDQIVVDVEEGMTLVEAVGLLRLAEHEVIEFFSGKYVEEHGVD